jgi:hypothetical protein
MILINHGDSNKISTIELKSYLMSRSYNTYFILNNSNGGVIDVFFTHGENKKADVNNDNNSNTIGNSD